MAHEACAATISAEMADMDVDDEIEVDEVLRLEDDGDSLIVTTPDPGGEIASGLAYQAATCVLEETEAPATVAANMGATTALSGSQTDSWDDIEVVWSYSAGLDSAGFNATFAFTG